MRIKDITFQIILSINTTRSMYNKLEDPILTSAIFIHDSSLKNDLNVRQIQATCVPGYYYSLHMELMDEQTDIQKLHSTIIYAVYDG